MVLKSGLRIAALGSLSGLMGIAAYAEESIENIENITVYGQKISRSQQDTIESVAIFDETTIDKHRLFDLEDVFNRTANAFETNNGEGFGIRGVTQNSSSTGGGSGELGSLYIDGVAFTGFATRFGPTALWDVKQVEILRGPQSTNVGRNALIGAVVVTTNQPDPEGFDAAFRVDAGNYNSRSLEGMVNVPLNDIAAFRLTAETLETDGFVTNTTLNIDDYDGRSNQTVRGKLLIEPSEQLSIGFMAQYAETERGQNLYLVSENASQAELEQRVSTANLEAFEDYEATTAVVDIHYNINTQLSFTAITSMISGKYNRFDDDDEGPGGNNSFRGRYAEDDNWAQELRFNVDSDKLKGVSGIYYTQVDLLNNTEGLANIAPVTLGVPEVLLPFYPEILEVSALSPSTQETTNIAFFTEWDYQFAESWTLAVGFRFDREEQDFLTNTNNSLQPGTELPDPAAAGALADMLNPGAGAQVEQGITQVNAAINAFVIPSNNLPENTDYDAFLPKLGITYDISNDVAVSAIFKRGYRAGGVDINLANLRSDYDPETLDNFELSLRSSLLEDKLTINANAYYGDWEDQQVSSCPMGSLSCITINAGESTISGLEFELNYNASENATVYTSLGYSKTEFDKFIAAQGDLSGNEFAFSPDATASIGGDYWFTRNFSIAAHINYQGESWSDLANTSKLDSRTVLNMNARYEIDQWSVVAYGKNLADEFYLTSDNTGIDGNSRIVRSGDPREFGLSVKYDM